jgi:hypothetical protein
MYDLRFLLMIDADVKREDVISSIVQQFPSAVQRKSNSCDLQGNWIEVWDNEDYDPSRVHDTAEGYLHYRLRVEGTPIQERVTESSQIELVRELCRYMQAKGWKCVPCANFEDAL